MDSRYHEIYTTWVRHTLESHLVIPAPDGKGNVILATVIARPWSGIIKWTGEGDVSRWGNQSVWPQRDSPPTYEYLWRAAGTEGVHLQRGDAETLCRLRLKLGSHDRWMEYCSEHAWACVYTMKKST